VHASLGIGPSKVEKANGGDAILHSQSALPAWAGGRAAGA
jgi:hypothetical protein